MASKANINGNEKGNEQEAKENKTNSNLNNENNLGGSMESDGIENEEQENNGILIHSHTKGMDAVIHDTESEEHEDENINGHPPKIVERDKIQYDNLDGSENRDGIGIIHIGGVNQVNDTNNNNNNNNSKNDKKDNNNNNNNNNSKNNSNPLDRRIKGLQKKAVEGIESVVDNSVYTTDNPSVGL